MRLRRRRRRSDRGPYVVQLHRVLYSEADGSAVVQNSWAPITVTGTDQDAQDTGSRLLADNRWGGPAGWPLVTCTDSHGVGWIA